MNPPNEQQQGGRLAFALGAFYFIVKLVGKFRDFWWSRYRSELRIREAEARLRDHAGVEIGRLWERIGKLEETNDHQQAEINRLKRELEAELRRNAELKEQNGILATRVTELEAKVKGAFE